MVLGIVVSTEEFEILNGTVRICKHFDIGTNIFGFHFSGIFERSELVHFSNVTILSVHFRMLVRTFCNNTAQ